ncbi:MAG: alpha-glucan family phosphorylase [Dongiaceae bacterium]
MPLSPPRPLPPSLAALAELALDLRWTWSHAADRLWLQLDEAGWSRTRNPWSILQDVPADRLETLAGDPGFVAELGRLAAERRGYLEGEHWFGRNHDGAVGGIAYFSLEFGLGDALPLYAGGLGVLAGDMLKTASDLGVPLVGVGLLYQEGYFRQLVDASGEQQEAYPYNEPSSLPIAPVLGADGRRLHVGIELPGRQVLLRLWRAAVGRTALLLLDSNHPLNSPADRGITGKLYGGGTELRLAQEIALGVGGWRAVEALAPEVEICHLNEGHAAFVVIERARRLAQTAGLAFEEALWASRAGNVFTTHTPVEAGFDRYPAALVGRYLQPLIAGQDGLERVLALGRPPGDAGGSFNMAHLALRGSHRSVGVSRLHGQVSRRIFQPLFPRWPEAEVPVGHVTNGVHVPSWDSAAADRAWTAAAGKERWRDLPAAGTVEALLRGIPDEALWALRGAGRQALVGWVRARLARQLGERGMPAAEVAAAAEVLDPNLLTLGLARRFTAYKRPNLLLRDPDRLRRILADPRRPVQIVVAGKAHPEDAAGKAMIREWVRLGQSPELRRRVVFLADYDITLAQELVQGVDLWINTPRRPWEACGTSGMKLLANGGLNLSVRDGWWAEAYEPGRGWAIGGDGAAEDEAAGDAADAEALYGILESEVVPAFYERDAAGLPRAWLARVRRSIAELTPAYSAARMLRDYLEQAYRPATAALRRRLADGGAAARALAGWAERLARHWGELHLGPPDLVESPAGRHWSVPAYLGDVGPDEIRLELFAETAGGAPEIVPLVRGEALAGTANGYLFAGREPGRRPAADYTVRILPQHPEACLPAELPLIFWQR